MGSIPGHAPTSLEETLPTLDWLNVAAVPDDLDIQSVAQKWLTCFSSAVHARSVPAILDTIHPGGWWRDLVALTWDLRTFHGAEKIKTFLHDRLVETQFSVSKQIISAELQRPHPDLQWIFITFGFETGSGVGHGTAFLVPTSTGEWVAFVLCTDLDSIKGTKPRYGPGRDGTMNRGDAWLEAREREQGFADADPEVLIVGAGQSGLGLAARLTDKGVSTLIIEKNARVGDQWRQRYDSLRLQSFVWADHLPYMQFPDSFPAYLPAKKFADWLEFYASAMDLNVWNDTTVMNATRDEQANKWNVTVKKQDGTERVFRVDHVVFATGWVGEPSVPSFPGQEEFQGRIHHSAESYKNAKEYVGKKVVVVGACSSGHDVAVDCAIHNIDVTMLQRSSTFMIRVSDLTKALAPFYREDGPPLDIADRMIVSMPHRSSKLLGARDMADIAADDQEQRDKLEKLGYRINKGPNDGGVIWHLIACGGGQYLDQGACDLIIEGKIKIKSNTEIERFTKTGLRFQDGTEIQADVVVLATGYGDLRDPVKRVVGEDVGKRLTKIWRTNEEGELNTVYKEMGVPGLWYLSGSLAFSRIYSKYTALQIKAKQAGLLRHVTQRCLFIDVTGGTCRVTSCVII